MLEPFLTSSSKLCRVLHRHNLVVRFKHPLHDQIERKEFVVLLCSRCDVLEKLSLVLIAAHFWKRISRFWKLFLKFLFSSLISTKILTCAQEICCCKFSHSRLNKSISCCFRFFSIWWRIIVSLAFIKSPAFEILVGTVCPGVFAIVSFRRVSRWSKPCFIDDLLRRSALCSLKQNC